VVIKSKYDPIIIHHPIEAGFYGLPSSYYQMRILGSHHLLLATVKVRVATSHTYYD